MRDNRECRVFFVGAGPGAKDLITLRGARLLESADVVVWAGSLVNPELLEFCRSGAELFDSSAMSLGETTKVLAEAAERGKLCVRLHTGDPSIFGAVREQMEELKKRGIEYDVVPGVSSLCAAAASLKAEYTVPEVSQSLIITRMAGRTPVPERERIRMMARHGASMAVFLSGAMIGRVVDELLSGGGYAACTPAAVIYRATWRDETVIRGTLADIAEKTRAAGIRKTALILAGDFLGADYKKSRLYDKSFATEFRGAQE